MSYTYSFINKNTAITVPINSGIVHCPHHSGKTDVSRSSPSWGNIPGLSNPFTSET